MRKHNLLLLLLLVLSLAACAQVPQETPALSAESIASETTLPETTAPSEETTEPTETVYEVEVIQATDIVPQHDTEQPSFYNWTGAPETGELYEATYFHFPNDGHNKHMQYSGDVFLRVKNEDEMKSGNHYEAYVVENGQLVELKQTRVDTYQEADGRQYHFDFAYAVYLDQIISTYTPRPNSIDDLQSIYFLNYPYCIVTLAKETETGVSYLHMYYNLETGVLTDLYQGLTEDKREVLRVNSISSITYLEGYSPDAGTLTPENARFVLNLAGGSYFYVDIPANRFYDLEALAGEELYSYRVVDEKIICGNDSGDVWKIDGQDLTITQLINTDGKQITAPPLSSEDSSFMLYKAAGKTHIYDFLTETDIIVQFPVTLDTSTIQYFGRKFVAQLKDSDTGDGVSHFAVFDCDKMRFLEFSVENTSEYACQRDDERWSDHKMYQFMRWLPDGRFVLTTHDMHEFIIYNFM